MHFVQSRNIVSTIYTYIQIINKQRINTIFRYSRLSFEVSQPKHIKQKCQHNIHVHNTGMVYMATTQENRASKSHRCL